MFGDGEFFPNNELIKILGKYVCPADMELLGLCENVLFLICGFDQANINMVSLHQISDTCRIVFILSLSLSPSFNPPPSPPPQTRLPVYYTHTPAGTSVKNCAHFAQEVKSGRFAKYDYGTVKNLVHYGSVS